MSVTTDNTVMQKMYIANFVVVSNRRIFLQICIRRITENFPIDVGSATGNLAPVVVPSLLLLGCLWPEIPLCARLVDILLQVPFRLRQFYHVARNYNSISSKTSGKTILNSTTAAIYSFPVSINSEF